MNDKIRFVFSTRELGNGKAFSQSEKLGAKSAIRKYLDQHFLKKEETGTDEPQELSIEKEISSCPGNNYEEKHRARYSYYHLSNNNEAFAVPHLEWPANKEWIKALVEEKFSESDEEVDKLYLILHDNDVPGYNQTPYHILSSEETHNLLDDEGTHVDPQDDGEFYTYQGKKIKIIVFRHTWNDVTNILADSECTIDSIKKRLGANEKTVNAIFQNKDNKKVLFNNLDVNASVDFCANKVDESKIKKQDGYYVYEDNGALLAELMHYKTDIHSSKQFMDFVEMLRKPAFENNELKDVGEMRFPLILKIYKSFFKDWEDALDCDEDKQKVSLHRNNKALKDNLNGVFSFFNNSSIWVRIVDINDDEEYNKAVDEINYFEHIGLYDYPSAKEILEYNTRIFSNNYLLSTMGGHGSHLVPTLCGNEIDSIKILCENSVPLAEGRDEQPAQEKARQESAKVEFEFMKDFHDIALRILLIDDKIGEECEFSNSEEVVKCNGCCRMKSCKLCTIKRLMDDGLMDEKSASNGANGCGKNKLFNGIGTQSDYFYWREKEIDCFFYPKTTKDFIDGNEDIPNIERNLVVKFEPDKLHVQIIGVKDVRTALLIMKNNKFDMVFCDYLLAEKSDGSNDHEHVTQLFDFLSHNYKTKIKNCGDEKEKLEKLRRDALDNRGPINKFWIMPVTGFNQVFIQDLYNNNINLIDYKWNISNGADPITTPWQFLYHLNEFIELLLKSCIYRMDKLLRFVKYTCEDILELKKKRGNDFGFFEFQSFMGSEHANFMRRYGNRHLIQRDAVWDEKENDENKSVFATYVWKKFYAARENRDVIELNRLIQRFLYQASTMHNDKEGQQRIDEAFGKLCHFINRNMKVQKTIKENDDLKKELEEKMNELRSLMDNLSTHRPYAASSDSPKQQPAEIQRTKTI